MISYPVSTVFLLFGFIGNIRTDDQFLCCMKGIKAIRNIAVCPAPCCYGYEERTFYASIMSRITFCERKKKDVNLDETTEDLEKLYTADTTDKYDI